MGSRGKWGPERTGGSEAIIQWKVTEKKGKGERRVFHIVGDGRGALRGGRVRKMPLVVGEERKGGGGNVCEE